MAALANVKRQHAGMQLGPLLATGWVAGDPLERRLDERFVPLQLTETIVLQRVRFHVEQVVPCLPGYPQLHAALSRLEGASVSERLCELRRRTFHGVAAVELGDPGLQRRPERIQALMPVTKGGESIAQDIGSACISARPDLLGHELP
jgi:hypothetical protein